MDLYLVRHATSTRHKVDAWGRLIDLPLDADFKKELAGTRSVLSCVPTKRVFSSPLMRCIHSAEFVCPNDSIRVVNELRAYHSGVFEHQSITFMRTHHLAYASLQYRDKFLDPKFGEESIRDQAKRVASGLLRVLRTETPAAVIVTHYSTINIVAHFAARNWDHTQYGDGVYDVTEGGLLHLPVEAPDLIDALMRRE